MDKKLRQALRYALRRLFEDDKFLLENGVWETSVSAKLVAYLQVKYSTHDVDHEYNRHLNNPKLIFTERAQRPDIVIHKRGSDESNIAVIEIKTRQDPLANDIEKLKMLTDQSPSNPSRSFKYKYGIHIEFAYKEAKIKNVMVFTNRNANNNESEELKFYLIKHKITFCGDARLFHGLPRLL